MGLVPNLEFMRINTKSPKFFLMLKLPYVNNGVKIRNSIVPTMVGGSS
jgi:hypothetical protein